MKTRVRKSASPANQNPSGESAAAPDQDFPIVAIGASAGGLEAYTELFHALPVDTGMAFVVVQHLDPNHQSMLTEILGKATKLPVNEVKSGDKIRANFVYVIPPNAFMALSGNVFQLTPRSKGPGQHLAVNFFMRSLADGRGSKAIGVILSGTGADGTLGLENIKAEGGITFAQDPATAKYDGMPRSAIDSGCVDLILSPKEIAEELQRIKRHPYVRQAQRDKGLEPGEADSYPSDDKDFTAILNHLRRASGTDFSQYRFNTIHRRSLRRMAILKLESLSEYAKYMKEHPDEGQKLYDDVLIPVTSFFRDFEAFEALKTGVYPAIVKEVGSKGTIRMWAPGCSTGEETYSLAMTLLEFLGDKAVRYQVQIFGTDLNEKGIEKARAGLYRTSIADEISAERLHRFFVKVEEGYRVNKAVRDMCIFARQNLANDPPFSQMNLVACRNLLIYIQPVLQKKIIPILHYALKPSGFLLMGSSESAAGFPELFSTVDKKNKIYSKKPTSSRLPYDFAQSYRPPSSGITFSGKPSKREAATPNESNLEAEADRVILKSHAPVGVVVNAAMEVVQFRGRTTPYLESPPGKSSLNLFKLARHGLAIELRTLISSALKKVAPVRKDNFIFAGDGDKRILNLSVSPLEDESSEDNRFFLVLFDDITAYAGSGLEINSPSRRKSAAEDTRELTRLKQELAGGRDALHAAIESEDALKEEFQSANEEILSANEELQSTNEELETSKEELQSVNEELNTVNDELRTRNVDLGQLNNDLANLLDAIRIPVVFVGADLRIRRLTSAATDIFRVLPSDVGRPITDIKHNLDVPDLAKMIQDTVANLTSTEREVQGLDGRWRSLEIRPYRTADNRIEGAVIALPDIDRLKQAEHYLKKIIDNIPNPLLVLDADLKVLMANLTFCKTFDVSQTATIGEPLYRLGNGQWNIPGLRELLEKVLPKNESVKDYLVAQNFPDIGQKTMVVSGRRIEDVSRGSSPMILLAIEDVTERRQAEEARDALTKTLEQQFRTFDMTLSSITDFAYTFNRQGKFIYVNPPLLNLWGLKLEEAVGKTFSELPYPEEMAKRLQSQIQQVIATRKAVADETPYTNPMGVTRYYEYIFNPVIGGDGTVELVAGSTRDITERRLAEAALIKSEKLAAAGRLAATLAHEINNPLQAVTNLITILKGSKNLDTQDQTFATMAEGELNRVTRLTQQSLAFYRESISPTSVTPEEVLDIILNLYSKRTAAKNITAIKQYPSNGTTINSFPGEVRQIFSTLLLNAVDAVPMDGTIAIRVRRSTDWKNPSIHGVQIVIADSGVGIPAHNVPRIFEPFFTTKGEQGTGLGLWVASGIVNRLGGSIRMRSSVQPGKSGTSFSVFLPNQMPNGSI